jgi:hypothetical protein
MKWEAAEWAMIILATTIPLSVLGLIIMRVFTNAALSDNAGDVINNITTIIGGGIISIVSYKMGLKNKQDEGQNIRTKSSTTPPESKG